VNDINQYDIAEAMAQSWNAMYGVSSMAEPIDMWPCCNILAQSGVIVGQQEDLSAISMGPFKVAIPRNRGIVRDFVEVLFPATVAALPASQPLTAAVSGSLSAACLVFVKLLDRGVIFGRSPADTERWNILMFVTNCNSSNFYPTICEVINEVALITHWEIRPSAADVALKWLISHRLIACQKTGLLKSLV
jgi:hypothetical protein